MDSYLIDTNVISVLYDPSRPNYHTVLTAISSLNPDDAKLVSVVTIAELKFGLSLVRATGGPTTTIEACVRSAEAHPLATINKHTAEAYADIKSSVAKARLNLSKRKVRWVESWPDKVTGQLLQIDESDLWIAAQALERNYMVLSADKAFADVLAPAVPTLRLTIV